MGEEEKHPQKAIPAAVQAMIVDTLGGTGNLTRTMGTYKIPFGR
ncbi:MAG: hypothetical protein WC934_12720 [Acidithiobacillus sp.]|jgi:hypothetical protein